MPRNPHKQRCRHDGCNNWAQRGQDVCRAHAQRLQAQPDDSWKGTPLPTLEEEIKRLAERRERIEKVLLERVDQKAISTPEALRYLATLAQVGRAVARMLAQADNAGSRDEVQRMLDAVAGEIGWWDAGEGAA
ncbi:MAG: hypothetical protein ACUVX9_12800 [Anaerolineae bacterium]